MQRGGSKQNSGSAHKSGSRDVNGDGGIPDGWYRIQASPPPSSSNNAHPATPPGSAASAPSSLTARSAKDNSSGPDSLGLVRATDPMRMLLRETRVKDKMMMAVTAQKPAVSNGLRSGLCSSAALKVVSRESHTVRSSPRHLKLVQKQVMSPSNNCTGLTAAVNNGARRSFAAAEAFSPQRSLRLASLRRHLAGEKEKTQAHATADTSASISIPQDRRSADLPLHELIRTVDDAVDADPHVDSNQAAITQLFMAQWLAQFDANRRQFKSIAVHAEVGFQELYRFTANLPSPNEFVTAFACKVLGDLVPHFGPYAPLLHVLRSELHLSAYASSSSSSCPDLPYFAIVKNQKRLVLALRKDKKHRRERNEFLAHEIQKVHVMFRHFLDECSSGLVRTLFREWYSIAVIRKKNSKKYIEYFSAWFAGSAKSLVPKLFATWKHDTVQRKMDKMQAQLTIDGEKLSNLQRQIDELSVQRDTAQIESLAVRNDRKQAEDMIQRLNRKIQSAGAFLEGSYRREGLVCQEGQLRVEAASFLPPLILESLLRGYHNVGFLQQLHNEFIPKQQTPGTVSNQTAATAGALQRKQSTIDSSNVGEQVHDVVYAVTEAEEAVAVSHGYAVPPSKNTVLQDCLAEIIKLRSTLLPQVQLKSDHQSTAVLSNRPGGAKCLSDASISQSTLPPSSAEISIQDFARLFQSIQQRMDAKNVHVLFTKVLPATKFSFIGTNNSTRVINEEDKDEANDDDADAESPQEEIREIAHETASLYEQVIHAIRAQDEHYARNTKLFSSRMLESHEVSIVPQTQYSNLSRSLAGSDGGSDEQDESQRSVTRGSLSVAPLQSEDLGVINGTRRFSMANICPVKMTAMNFEKHAPKTSSNSNNGTPMAQTGGCFSPPSNAALERLELIRWSDFGISSCHTRSFFMLFLAHLASEFGSLLFSPADMSAFMHNAYVQSAQSPPGKEPKGKDDQGFHDLVTAYEIWNRLAGQMIDAEIAQSRGETLALTESAPGTADGGVDGAAARRSSSVLLSGAVTAIRPKLQFHIEPLSHGVLMTSSKEKETSSSSPTHQGGRLSLTLGETFHTARIRRLSIDDATKLTKCIRSIHRAVQKTSTRLHDFNVVRQQIRDFWHLQWEQASDLAGQFSSQTIATTATTATAAAVSPPVIFTSSHLTDERKHVFECISFENPVIERIFSIEDNPSEELERVRATFKKKKHLVRHLYTKHRAHIQHAVSLDDLWHFVKVLRFPKEIHMLPAMRDEDMAVNGFEQLFSPDDLAEILLQLCNEQFLPQITPLSSRVEHFARHHLPFAAQNQSIIRELMHQQDVKRALADHSQTTRIIFRRYCAKERDLGMLIAITNTNTNTHTQQASSNTKNSSSHRPARHTSHGITKYMRLIDWLAFIQDYNLLRPRFPLDYAVVVFRNVQEVASNASAESTTAADEQLEMIYSEFCEALVGVAACFFPDPFLKSATKVSQFIQRFLPVSPEEVCSHV